MESSLNEDPIDYEVSSTEISRSGSPAQSSSQPAVVVEENQEVRNLMNETDNEPKCAICLQPYQNKSFLDRCFHAFCFSCIMTWSSRAQWCPLCKTTFSSLIYNVRNEKLFDQYHFGKKNENQSKPKRTSAAAPSILPKPSRSLSDVERRRSIYANRLFVRPETDTRLVVREREIGRLNISKDPIQKQRLEEWISREITAIVGAENHLIVFTFVMSLVQRMEFTSPVFATLLRPFLLDNTTHFVHELLNFARSPLDIHSYDRRAQYDDAPIAERLKKSDISELDRVPSREKTPPHVDDYARAIRHMMNITQREGNQLQPIDDRDVVTPPSSSLLDAPPSPLLSQQQQQSHQTERKSERQSPTNRPRSRSPHKHRHSKHSRHSSQEDDQGKRESRRSPLRNRGNDRGYDGEDDRSTSHTHSRHSTHHKSHKNRKTRHDDDNETSSQRQSQRPSTSNDIPESKRLSSRNLGDNNDNDRHEIVISDDSDADSAQMKVPRARQTANRNQSPPIKRKASPQRPHPRGGGVDLPPSPSPQARIQSSPDHKFDISDNQLENVALQQTSLASLQRELAEVEAAISRDRAQLASLLLKKELKLAK